MSKLEEKSAKKGLFGWFGKKDSKPDTEIEIETKVVESIQDSQPITQEFQPAIQEFQTESVPEKAEVTPEKIEALTITEQYIEETVEEKSETKEQQVDSLPEPQAKPGFFSRLSQGLKRTRENLAGGLADLFLGDKQIDEDLFEEIETQLLMSDVGIDATQKIIKELTEQVSRKQLADSAALFNALKQLLANLLAPVEQPLEITSTEKPFVILMVGVNGVGKTTTIGKLAKRFQQQGKSVMLAAGDTFRAAAVEQLQVWGQRNDVPVIAQHTGADSASVIFDALQAATARGVDVLIADTAGRLQNKAHLMDELAKVKRVMQKIDPQAPHETLLVLDAGTGQNAINQTQQFHQEIQLSGLAVSKLDGTAKGGVLFALAEKFAIPVRYIGVGEAIDDLRTFNASDFIQALFGREGENSAESKVQNNGANPQT